MDSAMGKDVIHRKLKIQGELGYAEAEAILDTGASISIIKDNVATKVARVIPWVSRKIKLANDKSFFTVNKISNVLFELEGYLLEDYFFVVDSLPADMILGVPTLQRWEITIDFKTKKVKVGLTPDDLYII
jgi:predicted aspartyl protease